MYWLLFGLSLILLYYLLLTICCLNNFIKIIVALKSLKRKTVKTRIRWAQQNKQREKE